MKSAGREIAAIWPLSLYLASVTRRLRPRPRPPLHPCCFSFVLAVLENSFGECHDESRETNACDGFLFVPMSS